ncbi:B-cell linker protein isoform X2 [Kryptolebias marmoratus]|uniref:B-cell linker protein isoform X2 n=1 Tax=Kryptolebias marmoratus TaxID=37003 RepID=UPI000D52F629|nr:B-cell linker protein isoform X2 [Kryptolebias marmoratus]
MNLPTRQECEGWDQTQVALFMCKNKMQECAATVARLRINGHRLLNLTENDISKFSLIHQLQLQKIVQDIKKNDGSLLDRLRRLKTKPCPTVPVRDYRDNHRENDDSSDSEYDNETYEDPHDDSYEPPPSHRDFSTNHLPSLPGGEYLDSCRGRPSRPPKRPPHLGKASKQLPPEPPRGRYDQEDYIDPDGTADDDNYIEPSENQPPKPMLHGANRTGADRPAPRGPSPDFYEVPDKEDSPAPPPVNRLFPIPAKKFPPFPKPSPRLKKRLSPLPVPESTCEDTYEICDPDDSLPQKAAAPPPRGTKPFLTESPKPPLVPKPDLKPREFESRSLPAVQTELKLPPKAFSLDFKRPKVPLPQFTLPKPAERGSVAAENGPTAQDKDADVGNKAWFAAACDRRTADDALLRSNKDGAFMVRKSSGHDAQQPYTLVVLYNGRVYNIPIRFIPATQQFALGREKKGEEYFSSVSHIIENHQKNPLVLIDIQSNTKDATKLCHPVKP